MEAHHTGGLTIDLTVTACQCGTLANGGPITLKDETLEFKKGVSTTVVKQKDFDDGWADLSDKYRNECNSYEWVNRKTFEGHVQDVVLKVRTKDDKVVSKDGLQKPWLLEKLGCDATSFYPYAYTWEAPDNCILASYRKEDINKIKQGKNIYYIVSGRNNTSQCLFEVKTEPKRSSVTNQYKYTRLTTSRYTWLSTLVDSIWLLGKEWDSQEEHNTYNTTSHQFRLTASFFWINLSHPIQITLTQKRLISST